MRRPDCEMYALPAFMLCRMRAQLPENIVMISLTKEVLIQIRHKTVGSFGAAFLPALFFAVPLFAFFSSIISPLFYYKYRASVSGHLLYYFSVPAGCSLFRQNFCRLLCLYRAGNLHMHRLIVIVDRCDNRRAVKNSCKCVLAVCQKKLSVRPPEKLPSPHGKAVPACG